MKTSTTYQGSASPRKGPLSNVTDEKLKIIEDKINNWLRKRLRFKTPNKTFSNL
jgi:IS30 family transposase